MDQNEADAYELENDTHCEELGNGMTLFSTSMYLYWNEEDVDSKEDETLLKDVLLIIGEVEYEGTVES